MEKYINGKWQTIPVEDHVKITKLDGQVWICLYNLLLKGECQRKYDFNGFNKNQLLKVLLNLSSSNRSLLLCPCGNRGKRVRGGVFSLAAKDDAFLVYDASSYYTFLVLFLFHSF